MLEKKFEDFVNEVKPLGHSRVVSLHELASKLEKEGHSKMDIIQKRTKQVNEMWEKLCHAIQTRTEVGLQEKLGTEFLAVSYVLLPFPNQSIAHVETQGL